MAIWASCLFVPLFNLHYNLLNVEDIDFIFEIAFSTKDVLSIATKVDDLVTLTLTLAKKVFFNIFLSPGHGV